MSEDRRRRQPGPPVRGSSTGRPIMALLDLLGRRWTLRIIWELHLSSPCPLTFRSLQQRCEDMSPSVLNQRLGELRKAQLVGSVTGGYTLTDIGTELITLFLPLGRWADNWAKHLVEPAVNRTCAPEPPGPLIPTLRLTAG